MSLQKDPSIEDVKSYYNKFIQYRTNREGNSRIKELYKFIDSQVAGKNYQSVLDVGCGEGLTTEYLLRHVPSVVGTDLSEERISICKANGKANYLQMDYSSDAVKQVLHEPFDLVCVFDCAEHILPERRKTFLENIYRSFTEKVLVSIPEPNNLRHLRETRPNILQIVDEIIFDEDLSMFEIIEKIPKGIYVFYVLGKKF
jgi:2-polyprenyl-3-methyl-5-hydroxy-6-metoxy-1,4-benzoquinol methylase